MHKKFEINWTKIKGGCRSGRKVVIHNSNSDLPLALERCKFFLNKLLFLNTMSKAARGCLADFEVRSLSSFLALLQAVKATQF